ncbi:hypothetical protein [Microbacterium sp. NPDC090003]|uniref:hypothetical protein n=1 Tax=Microbacterium sp. NPDC090003 TaxID=3364203 RepID=UPI00382037D1
MKIRPHTPLVASAVLLGLMASGTAPAYASLDTDPDQVAQTVAAVAPTELSAVDIHENEDHLSAPLTQGGEAVISRAASDGLTFSSDPGEQGTTISLPGASALSDAAVSADGSVTYAGNQQVPAVNVVASEDAVRISTVITSPSQPQEFAYDFGAGNSVEIQEDGSVVVVSDQPAAGSPETEVIVASIDAPWATDASGVPVATHYVAEGSVLTQVVEHRSGDTTYPVVADPTVDQPNIFQYRVRFDRAETAAIASGGWGGVVGSFSCGVMAPVCALATGSLAYNAGVAQNSSPKKCVQVTATQPMVVPGMVWWVDTYAGGPCT